MPRRLFRLMELLQKLDERLVRERTRRWADPFEIVRLRRIKRAIQDRIVRLGRGRDPVFG